MKYDVVFIDGPLRGETRQLKDNELRLGTYEYYEKSATPGVMGEFFEYTLCSVVTVQDGVEVFRFGVLKGDGAKTAIQKLIETYHDVYQGHTQ